MRLFRFQINEHEVDVVASSPRAALRRALDKVGSVGLMREIRVVRQRIKQANREASVVYPRSVVGLCPVTPNLGDAEVEFNYQQRENHAKE